MTVGKRVAVGWGVMVGAAGVIPGVAVGPGVSGPGLKVGCITGVAVPPGVSVAFGEAVGVIPGVLILWLKVIRERVGPT